MKCLSCGAELSEGTLFCTFCGTKVAPAVDNQPTGEIPAVEENTAAVTETVSQSEPAAEPYTVNEIPVVEPQAQYDAPAPAPQQPVQPQQQYAAPQPPVYQQPAYQQPVYQQPVYQQPVQPVDPGKSNAMVALILGIVSVFFSPTALIGLGAGIAGIFLAMKSKKATAEAGLPRRTEELVGFITSIGGTVISGIALLIGVITIILPLIFGIFTAILAPLAMMN